MRKVIVLLFILIVNSCQKKSTEVILNNEFKVKLLNYIKKNPIKVLEKNAPKPIYQVFFEQKDKDTIITFKLVPHLTPYSIIDSQKSKESSEIFPEIDYKGYFLINKTPIVIFDLDDYSNNVIAKNKLKKPLLDDYKFKIGKVNRHIKSTTSYYKLSNNKLEKILDLDKY